MATTYWIIGTGLTGAKSEILTKESLLDDLRNRVGIYSEAGSPPLPFNVPDGPDALRFGSFDNLIRLSDDLQKHDQQVESVVRRIERTILELDPDAVLETQRISGDLEARPTAGASAGPSGPAAAEEAQHPQVGKGTNIERMASFQLLHQKKVVGLKSYISNWTWDDAKYPRARGLTANLTLLLSVVNKLDDDARNRTAQWNELKTQRGNLDKSRQQGALASRDLIDVFTPSVVNVNDPATIDDDFIETEHMTTVVLILGRTQEKEFLATYQTLVVAMDGNQYEGGVVPRSARKFESVPADKDGNCVWRVVLFKGVVEEFKKACRDRKFTTREFHYNKDEYERLQGVREKNADDCNTMEKEMKLFCKAAWSDIMISFVHIKAMRVFVESTLRYGVPPNFAAFILTPSSKKVDMMRKALAAFTEGTASTDGKADADDEEYYPYVSINFTPFAPKAQ